MDIELVWHAIQSVLTLVIIGGVGYVLARGNWFTAETKALLPKLVTLVALPPYMLYNITSTLTHDDLMHMAYGTLVPMASIVMAFGISIVLARLLKVGRERYGIFCSGFTASNTIFIGLPVNIALFGEAAVPYVLLYYFANTLFFWTIGNYMLSQGGEEAHRASLISKKTLKQLLSPPILGMLAGVAVIMAGVPLPQFISTSAKYLGSLTTPLAIMIIGITLQGMNFSSIKLERELVFIALGRFVVSPLTIIAITWFVPLPELMRQVFIIQSSLPAVVSLSLLASFYKSDPEFAAVAVSSTTLISIITIPLFMVLVTHM